MQKGWRKLARVLRFPTSFLGLYWLESDPNTVRSPAAAPLMLAPTILVVVGPLPIVAINVEPEFGFVFVFLLTCEQSPLSLQTMAAEESCRRKSQSADDFEAAISKMLHGVLLNLSV